MDPLFYGGKHAEIVDTFSQALREQSQRAMDTMIRGDMIIEALRVHGHNQPMWFHATQGVYPFPGHFVWTDR